MNHQAYAVLCATLDPSSQLEPGVGGYQGPVDFVKEDDDHWSATFVAKGGSVVASYVVFYITGVPVYWFRHEAGILLDGETLTARFRT